MVGDCVVSVTTGAGSSTRWTGAGEGQMGGAFGGGA
jgi:hypothetical protein